MDIDDLSKFLVVAHCNNLQHAASQLNQTPGALSKVIKRLELKLNTELFDRSGRNIILNQQGEKFRQYAVNLVHEAEQAVSEFSGATNTTLVKLAGPSVLMAHYLPMLVNTMKSATPATMELEFNMDVAWEGRAINQVSTGQAHLALVTSVAILQNQHSSDFGRLPIGETSFKVVASESHPIVSAFPHLTVTVDELQPYAFACPSVSPFCGIKRGIGSDGWRDDKVPRSIGFRSNDFGSMMSLVKAGLALAYVPDFVAEQHNLQVVTVTNCDFVCTEQIELVYKPSIASGWLNQITSHFVHD